LKRLTPSYAVEYRQAKRPNTESAKLGWAHAKPAPAGADEKASRIAISAFKTVAAHPPADVISPSVPSGRILPSLVETALVAGQADAGDAQSRSCGAAAQVPADGTVARQLGEQACPAEGLEPSVAVATIRRLEQPTTSDLSAEKAGTPRSEKRTHRPAEKQEKLDNAPRTSAERSETAPVNST
jgi:hypothetical protein